MSKILRKIFLLFLVFELCNLTLLSQNKLDVIVLDAGHGGKDPGTIGDNTGVQEKNIGLPVTMKLGKLIEEKFPDIKIIYIRTTDEFIDLKERTKIANLSKAKLFISVHANHKKAEETEKNGFEIYLLNRERFPEAVQITMKENSLLKFESLGADTTDNFIFSSLAQNGYQKYNEFLASNIEISMLNFTELASRGAIQAGFWVTLGASMPAVLVETGYLSDLKDERYLTSEKGQNDVAIALFNAFQSYKMLCEMQ
ncbi:MAG: N-acetylmuramoyl-L-alanine amidase [Chlorobi bacterium]|nr:N-acetylmuramoyl-L-alanine amidase [Chlorobiota bacterium]